MSLPKIDVPTYEIKIPSTGKEITVRPFLVGEEKLLLMAVESKDEAEIINTTKQIIKNCIVSGDINIDTLPFFDIDYIFIALRAKSVSDTVDVNYTCNNITESGDVCGGSFIAKIDIRNCEIVKKEGVTPDIKLSSTMLLKMKYPSYALMKTLSERDNNLEKKIKIIAGSIDRIIDKDKVYTNKDYTPGEFKAFIEGLTQQQFNKIEEFVDNFPSFVVKAEAKCPKCGFDHNLSYDDFNTFFL